MGNCLRAIENSLRIVVEGGVVASCIMERRF